MSAGHVSWPIERPVWTFDWRLTNDGEGTVFSNVRYRDHLVLYKASLPMIRVQYDTIVVGPFNMRLSAGPYKDQLTEGNSGGVRVREGQPNPSFRFLVVEADHRIGHYRITNRWIFRSDGIILPQLYSAGLQFPANHRHHVYWRLDFDIDGPDRDKAFWISTGWPQDWGWGRGWWPIDNEQAMNRDSVAPYWAIKDIGTGRGYFVVPGPFDGVPDRFARHDMWVTRYRGTEDFRGALGTPGDDQLLSLYAGGQESTHGTDIVLWYCAHLAHEASDHGDEWHVCGPILAPFGFG